MIVAKQEIRSMRRGLYAITDDTIVSTAHFLKTAEAVLEAGAVMLQWRNKPHGSANEKSRRSDAVLLKNLHALCRRYDAALIINDDVSLAKTIAAGGVHLGRDDMTVVEARSVLGEDAIIGASCYADLDLARKACADGANYVAFGSVFPSSTKPDAPQAPLSVIADGCKVLSCPVVAIGGITASNAKDVIDTGVDLVAVISGVWNVPDPAQAAANISQLFATS